MSHPVIVRKVESREDFRAFFEFPWTLYKNDPNWVPPLLSIRRDLLDKKKNPAWEYMEGEYFAAWRGSQIVGTVTAFINHRHNEFHEEHIGWFGTFEVLDDSEAAAALLNTAAEWVKARGYDAIRGPQSFTTHEECGLLVDNFSPPVLLMPYNPLYYQKLLEQAGFQKAMDVQCVYYDRELAEKNHAEERMGKIVKRILERGNITIRKIDKKRLQQEFERFKEIYNAAWAKNWGFVPMNEKELDALVESLGQFFEPDFAFFAEVNGEPAGFALSIPDLNEALIRAYPRPGVPEILSLIRVLWHWKLRPVIKGVRMPLMGVKAEYRNRGIETALFYYTLMAILPTRYTYVDAGWVLETNDLLKITDSFGAPRYKTFRFFEKRFKS